MPLRFDRLVSWPGKHQQNVSRLAERAGRELARRGLFERAQHMCQQVRPAGARQVRRTAHQVGIHRVNFEHALEILAGQPAPAERSRLPSRWCIPAAGSR